MVTHTLGSGPRTAVLLHGGGLSWWNYRAVADLLAANGYRVVLPVLDGHAGSDRPFTSIEDNASELVALIDRELGGRVDALGGVSLGAQVALEALAQRPRIAERAVIESALVLPMRAARALAAPAVALSYPLVRRPWFARAQFASLHLPEELYEPYYRDSCAISKRDMIAFMRVNSSYRLRPELAACGARATILVGGKEPRVMVRSARALAEAMPGSTLVERPGWRHGEASLWHPGVYLEALEGRP
ncbi:alpha/beta hydrolase [Olsenella sp. An285]|uniref:alpha/beta fold hydrolase n=1 Tax=Olsenella sp. An285 TaxID=1965621 RepID=UPI000B3A237B|nr:alpha/beta hydrolase [Olsenella sp. An285]OUO48561.1 alpha/beta hydrolase [Olsenella sp. An285]